MARPLGVVRDVVVRDATPDDLPDLLAMWQELRDLGSRGDRTAPQATTASVLARVAEAQTDPDVRIVVAAVGDEVMGMAVYAHQPVAALFEQHAAHVHYLHVRPASRRRGVGRALVAAAVTFAEDRGVEHVVTSVQPQLREANRFYARLGFAPMVVRRVAGVTALRRRLATDARVGALEEVLHRRRSMRIRSQGAVRRDARPVATD